MNANVNDDDLIPTRQSLIERLSNWGDQESWCTFFDLYWKLIYTTAVRSGLSETEAQDVVQETVVSVLKGLPDYDQSKSSFKTWLMRLTGWRIVDQFRKRQRAVVRHNRPRDGTTGTDAVEQITDPATLQLETGWDQEWEKNLLEAAVARLKRKVDPKHYQIFDLYFFKQWPVAKVARALQVNSGKVYLVKHRLGSMLKREVEALRAKPL